MLSTDVGGARLVTPFFRDETQGAKLEEYDSVPRSIVTAKTVQVGLVIFIVLVGER